MEASYTSVKVAKKLLTMFDNYGLNDKLRYITADNHGANDTIYEALALSLSDWSPREHRLRCLSYIINIAV